MDLAFRPTPRTRAGRWPAPGAFYTSFREFAALCADRGSLRVNAASSLSGLLSDEHDGVAPVAPVAPTGGAV
jgi:hypothetical protein